MSVVIDPGEVDCVCGYVLDFMMFLVYFQDNKKVREHLPHIIPQQSTLFRESSRLASAGTLGSFEHKITCDRWQNCILPQKESEIR